MKVYEMVFSPTGGTQKVVDALCGGIPAERLRVDLLDRTLAFEDIALEGDGVAVIAVPSYGGRVPEVAVDRLSRIQARGTRAVLVCVYGNRAYEDTLVELEDAARQAGFTVVAAVAAVAEHSIVRQYAAGRPDQLDQAQLREFARQIWEKLSSGETSLPQLPGNRPYKDRGAGGMVPQTGPDCVQCGRCAQVCPVGAIHPADPRQVDTGKCISCMRCVKLCPKGVRGVAPQMLAAVGEKLKPVCSDRKENQLFL